MKKPAPLPEIQAKLNNQNLGGDDRRFKLVLFIAIAAQALITFAYAVTLHFEFKTSGVDGMVYEQLMRNVLDGNGLVSSINYPYLPQPWLAFHFSPILYFLVPFYWVYPHFQTLLAVGSLCVALAAWPIYLTASAILQDSFQALLMALLYLLNPFVVNGVLWDFHEVDLAPLVLSWMLWAVVHGKARVLVALSVVLMCIKEHYGLSVAGFGLLWMWQWRQPRLGMGLVVAGCAVLAFVFLYVIPHFNPTHLPAMMNADSPSDRFGWMASSEGRSEQLPLLARAAVFYGVLLLLPYLLLPLASFMWLLPAVADVAANVLSKVESMRSVDTYYSMTLVPVLTVACCQTIKRYARAGSRFSANDVMLPIMVAAAGFAYVELALPFSEMGNIWELSSPRFGYEDSDKKAVGKISVMIGDDSALAAQMNILPHFRPRYRMSTFPDGHGDLEYVVLQLRFPFAHAVRVFGAPFGGAGKSFMGAVDSLLHDPRWGVVYYADGWVVLKKNGAERPVERKQAVEALDRLHVRYQAVLESMQATYRR